jgi:miniconductance mechanosensitive channel
MENATPLLQFITLQLTRVLELNITVAQFVAQTIAVMVLLISALISYWFTQKLLNSYVRKWVKKSSNLWDDALVDHHFFQFVSHIAPAMMLYTLNPILFTSHTAFFIMLEKSAVLYVMFSIAMIIYALLDSVHFTYNRSALSKKAPITGFIQVGKLILVIVFILLVISFLLNKSPLLILSGLGAIAAILLLVFRDTILGFVAGIQIAANRVVNTGDWIEMPKYGADGNVLAIGLTTVKVQNFDHTISTIPTYALISEPLKNWQGMQNSNGRRIKRAIYIDIQSVKFLDEKNLHIVSELRLMKDYLKQKLQELSHYHQDHAVDEQDLLNQRRLTNLGMYRQYMEQYLRQHPDINSNLTLMVRQLEPTEVGIPLEIYCFSKNKDWVAYEGIQADIFDHFLSTLAIFELRAYQRISDKG